MADPILLPERRGVKFDKPRMLDFGGQLRPPLGGEVQTLLRLGTRHALDITLPIMPAEPDGRTWGATLCLAKLQGVIAVYRQDGFRVGACGSPVADGGGQSGSVLALRGFTPGYVFKLGQAASLIHNGRRFLHFAAANAVADAAGKLALPIYPMLRKIVADGDVIEVAKPKIQGSLSGNEVAWTRLSAPFHDLGAITITEDA